MIYTAGGSIVIVPFDLRRWPRPATDEAPRIAPAGPRTLAPRSGGTRRRSRRPPQSQYRWRPRPTWRHNSYSARPSGPRVSPDGSRRSSCCGSRASATCGCTASRENCDLAVAACAILVADGRRWCCRTRPRANNLFMQPVDGSAPPHRLTSSSQDQWAHSFSRDGRRIFATQADPGRCTSGRCLNGRDDFQAATS